MRQNAVAQGFVREFLAAIFVKAIHPGDAEVDPLMLVDQGKPVMPGYEWETPDEWSARQSRKPVRYGQLPESVRRKAMEDSARFDETEVTQ